MVGNMRKGSILEKKIREASHDETKRGEERKHGKEFEPLKTAPAPKSSDNPDRNLNFGALGQIFDKDSLCYVYVTSKAGPASSSTKRTRSLFVSLSSPEYRFEMSPILPESGF
jgi:hypothetical protein